MRELSAKSDDPLDTILFRSPVVRIGKFRVWPGNRRFCDSGPIQRHVVVFPRTLVRITHAGKDSFIAGPDLVTYYNREQIYRRESVHNLPDRCEWFAFGPEVLRDALRELDPAASDRRDAPFAFSRGPSDPESYLRQRRVVEALAAEQSPDPMDVEEEMVGVLGRILKAAYRRPGGESAGQKAVLVRRFDRDLAEEAKQIMGRSFRRRLPLDEIATDLGVSIYRLCRTFRKETGTTLHRFRNRLRFAAALEQLSRRSGDLTGIALDLGFSSHSHFTAAFRREFGLTPSTILRDRRPARS